MSKVISLIIPTYNMASLLPRCLDSIIDADVNEAIEAIVVNDGSKDNSLEIAREYEKKYPECITVIDKPNGNYGSTINAALPVAKGKYVKILDSDDWVDSEAFKGFVNELAGTDADIAVTHFNIINSDGSKELSKYNVYGREPYEYGKEYDLDEVLGGGYIRFFLMHALSYRTQMLLDAGYRQTEGISYTDTQWCTYPLFYSKSIVFFNLSVYQYNLAREGQTMDPKVILRSLDQMGRMTFEMLDFYTAYDKSALSETRKAFLDQYYRNRVRILSKCYLYDIPRKEFKPEEFENVDRHLQEFIKGSGIAQIKLKPENKILPIDFYAIWQKKRRRPLPVVEKVNHWADILAHKVYKALFRSGGGAASPSVTATAGSSSAITIKKRRLKND